MPLLSFQMKSALKSVAHKVLSRDGKSERPFRVLTGPARGTKLVLDVRSQGSYWIGTYDRWITDRVPIGNFLKPGDTAWDCGAFVGYYTAIFRMLVGSMGSVFSFEASLKNFDQVARLPALNDWRNVKIINCAVGPERTSIKFASLQGGASGPVGLVDGVRQDILQGVNTVQSCGIDELVESGAIKKPDFIKFDLETGEIFALTNGHTVFSKKRPYVLLELHGKEALSAALQFLTDYQYAAAPVHELPKIGRQFLPVELARWYSAFRQRSEAFCAMPPFGLLPHVIFVIPQEKLI
jgi:FkbM family methyltransferase